MIIIVTLSDRVGQDQLWALRMQMKNAEKDGFHVNANGHMIKRPLF